LTLARIPQQIAESLNVLQGSSWLFMLGTILTLVFMGALLEGLPAHAALFGRAGCRVVAGCLRPLVQSDRSALAAHDLAQDSDAACHSRLLDPA
jgi:hypothetical protein